MKMIDLLLLIIASMVIFYLSKSKKSHKSYEENKQRTDKDQDIFFGNM